MKSSVIFTTLICLMSLGMGYLGIFWGMRWKNLAESRDSGALNDDLAARQGKINLLQEQLGLQRSENDRLNRRIEELQSMMAGGAQEAPTFDGPVLESLRSQIEGIRGLRFVEDLAYHLVPREEVAAIARERLLPYWSERDLEGRRLAYAAMGFVDGSADLGVLTTELLTGNIRVYYDQVEPAILIASDLDPRDSGNRLSVASAQVEAMIHQNFKPGLLTKPVDDSEEAALAFDSLIQGDISLVLALLAQKEMETGNIDHAANRVANQRDEALSTAPLFLRDLLMFPTLGGGAFCRKLHAREKSSFNAINAAYENPPRNTSEIFHEERYFGRIAGAKAGPASPIPAIAVKDAVVRDWEPVWSDVAGELRIRMLFKPTLVPKQASSAGIGWNDDRYWVYEIAGAGSDGGGGADTEHPAPDADPSAPLPPASVVWWTHWDTKKDSSEFFAALIAHLHKRHGLPDLVAPPDTNSQIVKAGDRRIHILHFPEKQEVLMIDATNEEWMAAFRASAFAQKIGVPGL